MATCGSHPANPAIAPWGIATSGEHDEAVSTFRDINDREPTRLLQAGDRETVFAKLQVVRVENGGVATSASHLLDHTSMPRHRSVDDTHASISFLQWRRRESNPRPRLDPSERLRA